MKNVNMTREEALNTITNLIQSGYSIPMASLGNGGAGFDFVRNVDIEALSDTENYNFRIVPKSEISGDFEDSVDIEDYDVCVEFVETTGDNPYREQYLLCE